MMSSTNCSRLFKNHKFVIYLRRYSQKKVKDDTAAPQPPPGFINNFAKLFGIRWQRSHDIITEHRKLMATSFEEIDNSIKMLETLNYKKNDLLLRPSLLYTSPVSIANRHMVLKECGCVDVSLAVLAKYIVVMNREIRILKANGIIPDDTNVAQSLADALTDVNLGPQLHDDKVLLKTVRATILNRYLGEKLHITHPQLEKLWSSYYRVRNKSFKSISEMIDIVTNELNFSNKRIINNAFVLYGDPENVRRIIAELKTIGGEDIHDILYRRPKIMMSLCDALHKSIEHITSFGIAESSINKCLDILTLSPDTIQERLQDLDSIEEFRVLKTNPRVLRLVHFQTKARLRLDYLNQLKVKCASLHVLSSHSNAFVRYTKDGNDKGKGCDTVVYLSNTFKRPVAEVRDQIARHPNWCHIPTVTIKQSYEFLISKMFENDDIFYNLQILLYPIKRINEKLVYLQQNDTFNNLHVYNNFYSTVTNRQMLALCLYLIELEFHFTGDGVWTDQDLHPVENFSSIIPDFPESWQKGYKFGMKPIVNKIANKATLTT